MEETVIRRIKAVADYIRDTKISVGDVDTIKRLLGCAETLEGLAEEMAAQLAEGVEKNEADHQ